jgi:tetratricopeptide (TPR) repeat protein
MARPILELAEKLEQRAADPDPVFVAWLRLSRGWLYFYAEDLGQAIAKALEGRSVADRTGASTAQAQARLEHVLTLAATGSRERTKTYVDDLIAFSEPIGFRFYIEWARYALALATLNADRAAESVPLFRELLRGPDPDSTLVGSAWSLLAWALVESGHLEEGAREADKLAAAFPGRAGAPAALVAMARRDPAQALSIAERGLAHAYREAHVVSILRLVRAEALHQLGRVDEARAAIREARDRILRNAATLDGDAELREAYVSGIRAHARTLALATAWLDG